MGKSGANLGFEAKLWAAADAMRNLKSLCGEPQRSSAAFKQAVPPYRSLGYVCESRPGISPGRARPTRERWGDVRLEGRVSQALVSCFPQEAPA